MSILIVISAVVT